jgi:two-component system, chemotaxis family, protein-glutamate methylesterase/glutaminase
MATRVLVVDDSVVMRKAISRMLEKDPGIVVAGTAANGREAIEKVEELRPDVVTLDIEMPVMTGLEALKEIMSKNPLPVIVLSALTKDGAQITMEALELGACDFVTKDFSSCESKLADKQSELIRKVKDVARNKARFALEKPATKHGTLAVHSLVNSHRDVVAIGASTGGPPALQSVLGRLPGNFPVPIAIAQHMPRLFTESFAKRLNSLCQIEVKEAEEKERLRPGVALIAPGDTHMALRRRGKEVIVEFVGDGNYIYRPSVDLLMSTTADAYSEKCIGLILTGMGSDGLAGLREMKSRSGFVIAQNEETCVVYGMPKVVVNAQIADAVLPLNEIAEEIIRRL